MVVVGGAVVALLIVALVVRHDRTGTAQPSAAAARPADTTSALAAPAPGPAAVGSPAAAAPRSRTADRSTRTKVADTPSSGPPPAPTAAGIRRYAQTWVNVRGERTKTSPTVGMLNPGDAVTVDSLVRGWYRVLVDGRTLGYVHRSMLDVSRPE
jgi:hypothetical protein